MSNINYVPVTYMTGMPLCLDTKNYSFQNNNLTIWENSSFFKYPLLLVSTYHAINWGNIRKRWNIPDDYVIIGDSGGFQNMTLGANLNPIQVLRWQEENCSWGFIFDLPIFSNELYSKKREKQKQTAINAQLALENRKNKNLKLLAVFQGHSIKEQEYMLECYKKYTKGLDKFDGIAIGGLVPISGNTEKLIKVLTLFCHNVKDYKLPIHFFGLSGNKIVPYIKYISDKFNLNITFDSSSYTAGGRRREFWKGNGVEKIKVMETDLKEIPCNCPVCSKVNDWNEYKKDGSISGGLISLHNLYQTIQYVDNLKNNFNNKILNEKYKRFIDIMFEFGPNKAFMLLDKIPENNSEQMNIFDF